MCYLFTLPPKQQSHGSEEVLMVLRFLFSFLGILILAQVTWWGFSFLTEVRTVENLRLENLENENLSEKEKSDRREGILKESRHRQTMFLSESVFFAFLTTLGLFLLFRANRSEQKLRDAQFQFIEVVSHESKTPLTALKLRLETLLEDTQERATQTSLQGALDEVRRLISVFEKTLQLNRLDRGGKKLLPAPRISLEEPVEDVLHRLAPFFHSRGATITTDLDPDVYARVDPASVATAVQSVLENAVLHHGGAPKITVRLYSDKGLAVLEISDDGPGIPPSETTAIFDRFYRGSTGKKARGSGLGLYLARRVVDMEGGRIYVKLHEAPGATFVIEFFQDKPNHA